MKLLRRWQQCAGAPVGGVTLNRVAGTSQRPCAPTFTRRMLDVMYWISTLSGDTSGPNCGSVACCAAQAASLRGPCDSEPRTVNPSMSLGAVRVKQVRRTARGAPALPMGKWRCLQHRVPSRQHALSKQQ